MFYSTVFVVCINTMKTTFYFNVFFYQAFKEQRHHVDKEKLSINIFSLYTCKLVIWQKLVRDQSNYNKSCFIVLI